MGVETTAPDPNLVPMTQSTSMHWIKDNYEVAVNVSLPRNTIYSHYLEYCKSLGSGPANVALFGKLIRTVFQHLKTRRLGTRGQSKYHYYGIAPKDLSRATGMIHYDMKDVPLVKDEQLPSNGLMPIRSIVMITIVIVIVILAVVVIVK